MAMMHWNTRDNAHEYSFALYLHTPSFAPDGILMSFFFCCCCWCCCCCGGGGGGGGSGRWTRPLPTEITDRERNVRRRRDTKKKRKREREKSAAVTEVKLAVGRGWLVGVARRWRGIVSCSFLSFMAVSFFPVFLRFFFWFGSGRGGGAGGGGRF